MTQEIADFVKKYKAKKFPTNIKDPDDETKSGDLGGYNLGSHDPESDKLVKKHTRKIYDSREGQEDPKDGVKDSLNDLKNKRLKGHGRNEKDDPMYESEEEDETSEKKKFWIKDAIKHPGALTKKAKKDKESPMEYAREHEHSSGKTGKQSRLALVLKKMHHESVDCDSDDTNKLPKQKKGSKLLLGDKLKEDTLANQIAIIYLNKRLSEKSIISGEHNVGCNTPDYTEGMEVNKKAGAEVQTEAKPAAAKGEKSKRQNYSYGENKKKVTEETEELDELSTETLTSYLSKARESNKKVSDNIDTKFGNSKHKTYSDPSIPKNELSKDIHTIGKRIKGIGIAKSRLAN
jgi:hypothetical protein